MATCFCWFLVSLNLQPWGWRRYIPPIIRALSELHGVTRLYSSNGFTRYSSIQTAEQQWSIIEGELSVTKSSWQSIFCHWMEKTMSNAGSLYTQGGRSTSKRGSGVVEFYFLAHFSYSETRNSGKNYNNCILSLIRHGPHWKLRVQQFFYCGVCIHYRGNVSTEPLPSNDRGDTHTHTQQRYLISLVYFSK
jgi:hypothetical protein